MSVWHLAGMGLFPGAVTVPLTYVYLALKLASNGEKKAKEFFELSGKLSQEINGAPEYIVVFTSEEVITGKEIWKSKNNVRDEWFNTNKKENAPKTIAKYLSNLLNKLKDSNFKEFYGKKWIKDIYFIKVNHEDFEDCYLKIGTTMCALKDKEVWVNMIGGTNQINLALLVAGSFFAVPSRYYYIFQSKNNLLHPEIDKPSLNHPHEFLQYLDKWHDMPIFHLEIGGIITELEEKFSSREYINIKEIEHLLEKKGYPKQYIAKLRDRLISIENEKVGKGPLLETVAGMIRKIEEQKVSNISDWKRWCTEKKILWRCNLDGRLEMIENDRI